MGFFFFSSSSKSSAFFFFLTHTHARTHARTHAHTQRERKRVHACFSVFSNFSLADRITELGIRSCVSGDCPSLLTSPLFTLSGTTQLADLLLEVRGIHYGEAQSVRRDDTNKAERRQLCQTTGLLNDQDKQTKEIKGPMLASHMGYPSTQ